MSLDNITVILPTQNEQENILAFLNALPEWVPLIVIDGSTDSTIDMIQELRPEKTEILRHSGTIAEARQLGAQQAETPWVLFTDADVNFAPDYFDLLQSYHGYDVIYDVIYGPKLSQHKHQKYYDWCAWGQQFSDWLGIPAASGSNMLVNRHTFFSVGGFDLKLPCNEDSELIWRIKKHGYQVLYNPELIVYAHDHRRLEQGKIKKTLHTLTRCLFVYYDLLPEKLRTHDWGYWSQNQEINEILTH